MRRSGRPNVVAWLSGAALRPLAGLKPTAFFFCSVRLAMPFVKLPERSIARGQKIWLARPHSRVRTIRNVRYLGTRSSNSTVGNTGSPEANRKYHRAHAADSTRTGSRVSGRSTQARAGLDTDLPRRYLCELNCACARRRLSAAAFNSGLRRSAASNSGMLSRGFPDARRANPKLVWAGALLGFNRSAS